MTPDNAPAAAGASELVDARLAAALRENPRTRKFAVDAIAALVLLIRLLRQRGWSARDAGMALGLVVKIAAQRVNRQPPEQNTTTTPPR